MINTFREEYKENSAEQKALIRDIKKDAQRLLTIYPHDEHNKPANREVALAVTKLEESIMWVVKGITK